MVAIHPNFIGAAFVAVFGYFLSFEIKHFQDIEEAAAQTDYGSHSSESFDFIIGNFPNLFYRSVTIN